MSTVLQAEYTEISQRLKLRSFTVSAHGQRNGKLIWIFTEKRLKMYIKLRNITKYRDFQLRLLHNKIFCNNILFHWKIKDSQKCDYCEIEKQDIVHLMAECSQVKKFWKEFKTFIKEADITENIDNVPWSAQNFVYNSIDPHGGHILNFLLLVAKYHIFRAKCNNEKPNFNVCKAEILMMHNIELYNATKCNRYEKHIKKWKTVNTTNFV